MTYQQQVPEDPRKWLAMNMGTVEYREAWDLQRKLESARQDGSLKHNMVLFLEHPPVFTLGRRGGRENLNVTEAFLQKSGVPVVQIDRGGNITYHGPGQLVIYPIIDLSSVKLSVDEYVTGLEELIIRTLADWGVTAGRDDRNRGVWVGNNKIGSIGISIRHNVCTHGLALNVNLSLEPFGWINPCGLHGVGMTSMERELSRSLPMDQIRDTARHHLASVFSVELADADMDALKLRLQSVA